MFPDVDAYDWDMRCGQKLIGDEREHVKRLSQRSGSWLAVVTISSFFEAGSYPYWVIARHQ